MDYNYLTLKSKKRKTYEKFISIFNSFENKVVIEINETKYQGMKIKKSNEIQYIFYTEELANDQKKRKTTHLRKLKKMMLN